MPAQDGDETIKNESSIINEKDGGSSLLAQGEDTQKL